MLLLMKMEFKKLTNQPQWILILSILVAVQLILMSIAVKFLDLSGFGLLGTTAFRRSWMAFLSYSEVFAIFQAATIGYFLVSREYTSQTWELLLLSIKSKTKVLWSKYLVSLGIYLIVQTVAFLLYLLITQTYFHYDIEWGFVGLSYVTLILLNLVIFCLQLSLHFLIPNAMTALASSLLLVMLPIFLGTNFIFIYILPLFSMIYVTTSGTFQPLILCGLLLWNVLFASVLLVCVTKYFRL